MRNCDTCYYYDSEICNKCLPPYKLWKAKKEIIQEKYNIISGLIFELFCITNKNKTFVDLYQALNLIEKELNK